MKKYKCHKVVEASKLIAMEDIGGDQLNFILEDKGEEGGNQQVLAPKSIISRYQPQAGDYLVMYEDGYLAISPGKAFEDGYTLIDDYKDRVLIERSELSERLEKLRVFTADFTAKETLNDVDKRLLVSQCSAMIDYLGILDKRIESF